MFGAGSGAFMVHNFGVRGHKSTQDSGVLIIHGGQLVAAKVTLFFYLGLAVIIGSHGKLKI